MESWVVGYEGNEDVERHADVDLSLSPAERGAGGAGGRGGRGVRALPRLRIRAVSDYICPWCYIGLVRIERLSEEFAVDFDVGAYELRPGIPAEGISRKEASAGRVYPPGYLDNLIQTARDAGIDMKRPPLVPNTRKAHEATEFAKEAGALLRFHHAVFAAYFGREENIGDTDVLCRTGADCGLNSDHLRRALDEGHYTSKVEEQLAWARAASITGVPTFIFDEKFALTGAQDYEVFGDVARRIVERRTAEG